MRFDIWMPAIFGGALIAGVSCGAEAQEIYGDWAAPGVDCASIKNHSDDRLLRITPKSLIWYEASCQIRSIQRVGTRITLQTVCEAEGERERRNTVIQMLPNGDISVSGTRYRKCDAAPSTAAAAPLISTQWTRVTKGRVTFEYPPGFTSQDPDEKLAPAYVRSKDTTRIIFWVLKADYPGFKAALFDALTGQPVAAEYTRVGRTAWGTGYTQGGESTYFQCNYSQTFPNMAACMRVNYPANQGKRIAAEITRIGNSLAIVAEPSPQKPASAGGIEGGASSSSAPKDSDKANEKPSTSARGQGGAIGSQAALSASCIKADRPATLTGFLVKEVFPGKPNYESIEKGDEAERTLMLVLPKSICLDDGGQFADPKVSFDKVQISSSDRAVYDQMSASVGMFVSVDGQGFGAQTAHHHAPMVFMVDSLRPGEK